MKNDKVHFLKPLFIMTTLLVLIQPTFAKRFSKKRSPKNQDVCVCQTGASPEYQIPFFQLGCIMWLATKSCNKKEMISVRDDISNEIPKESEGHTLHLGYVGHWGSSSQLIRFVENNVAPVIKEKDMSLKLDNTACNAMDDPELVKEYVDTRGLANPGRTIELKGNQTISIGGWNAVTFGDANLNAIVKNKKQKSILPQCKEFKNEFCVGLFQEMEVGRCVDKNGKEKLLFCKEKKFKFRALTNNRNRQDTFKRYVWDLKGLDRSLFKAKRVGNTKAKFYLQHFFYSTSYEPLKAATYEEAIEEGRRVQLVNQRKLRDSYVKYGYTQNMIDNLLVGMNLSKEVVLISNEEYMLKYGLYELYYDDIKLTSGIKKNQIEYRISNYIVNWKIK